MADKRDETGGRLRPSPDPRLAVGYVRVSSRGQEQHGTGLGEQRRAIEQYARENGITLLRIEAETASGAVKDGELYSHEHRPILQRLMAEAVGGDYAILLVSSLDRLSRDKFTRTYIKRVLARDGIEVVAASGETNGNGEFAELIDGLLGEIHDFERKRIVARMKAGREAKRKEGRHVHGRVPFGYRSERGVLTPKPELVPVVRGMFEAAAKGRSPAKIAADLTASGVPSAQGAGPWTRQAVWLILRNPVYRGENNAVKAAHPAIVARHTFNEAQRRLAERSRRRE